jgi:hypothetical protein
VSWHVTLEVFSGRPNPSWRLAGEAAKALSDRLRSAPSAPAQTPPKPPVPPGLGYRGFLIRREDTPAEGELRVYGGWITGPPGNRLDPGRALERWLLASAGDRLERPVFEHVLHSIEGRV